MHQKIINIDNGDCVAIFSDIHGNKEALLAILDDIKKKKIKNIICLGDTIAIGPNPKECLDLIIKENIPMVLGNHELYYLLGTHIDNEFDEAKERHHKWIRKLLKEDYRDYLSKCPMEIVANYSKMKVSFQHYYFNSNKEDPYPFAELDATDNKNHELDMIESDYLFIGHDHYASKYCYHDRKIYVVGSSGCTKDNQTFYTLLSVKDNHFKIEKVFLKYNRQVFLKELQETDYPDKEEIQRIFFGFSSDVTTKTLKTNHLILRKVETSDALSLFENWDSDKEMHQWVDYDLHNNINETKKLIDNWIKEYSKGRLTWVIEIKTTHEIIGVISASNNELHRKETEIGFSIGTKYQGKGYATEALKELIHYLLVDCDIETVKGGCFVNNLKSAKTMLRIGMHEVSNDGKIRRFIINKNDLGE